TLQLCLQRRVIWLPEQLATPDFFLLRWFAPRQIKRLLVKGVYGTQAGGVLARIQVLVIGRAVQMNNIARILRRQKRGAASPGESVKPSKMPVGIIHESGHLREARRTRLNQAGTREGYGNEQGNND